MQVPDPPEVDTQIEFRMVLPEHDAALGSGTVAGTGRIVRIVTPPERDALGFAIAIEQYDLEPTRQVAVN